jgi:hypothetical protein
MTETKTRTLDVPGAVLTYDVHEPERPGDHPPLFGFGSPTGRRGSPSWCFISTIARSSPTTPG